MKINIKPLNYIKLLKIVLKIYIIINPDYLEKIFKLYDYYVRKLIGQVDHRLSFRNQNKFSHNMPRC